MLKEVFFIALVITVSGLKHDIGKTNYKSTKIYWAIIRRKIEQLYYYSFDFYLQKKHWIVPKNWSSFVKFQIAPNQK